MCMFYDLLHHLESMSFFFFFLFPISEAYLTLKLEERGDLFHKLN